MSSEAPSGPVDSVVAALAFVARRAGRRSLSESRWSHTISFELGWMNPGEARAFVERARKAGLLEPDGDAVRLSFDPATVEVPRGFRPDPKAVPATLGAVPGRPGEASGGPGDGPAAPDPFSEWLHRLEATGRSREHILGEVALRQERLGGLLTAEAALLWIASEAGLDVAEAARAAEARLTANPSGVQRPGQEARP